MGFSTETTNNSDKPKDYIFYAEAPVTDALHIFKIVEQSEECYICHGDGPLFYLCVCRNYGRCKTCTLEAYSRGDQTCTICNEKYVYDTETKEVFNYSRCAKDCGKICGYMLLAFSVFAFWAFSFVGVSYGQTFRETYDLYVDEGPIHDVVIASYVIGGAFNVVAFEFWAIAPWVDDSPFKFKPLSIGYQSMLLFHQFIGVICIYAVTGEFIFNIVSMCIGSFFATGMYLLIGFCCYICYCSYGYKKELVESYTEHKKTIKLPTSI